MNDGGARWAHLAGAGWQQELAAGVRIELPLLLGVVPFGLVTWRRRTAGSSPLSAAREAAP